MRENPGRVNPADVELAAAIVVNALQAAGEADWSVPAGELTWTCRETLAHAADCVISYAAQLVDRAEQDFVPFLIEVEESTSPAGLLRVARVAAGVLAAVCRDSPADVRAYHPSGLADAEGFAAMAVCELLVHGNDVARGLKTQLHVEPALTTRVLARIFPDVAVADDDPWQVMLWAHGRVNLAGRPVRGAWEWAGAPEGERA